VRIGRDNPAATKLGRPPTNNPFGAVAALAARKLFFAPAGASSMVENSKMIMPIRAFAFRRRLFRVSGRVAVWFLILASLVVGPRAVLAEQAPPAVVSPAVSTDKDQDGAKKPAETKKEDSDKSKDNDKEKESSSANTSDKEKTEAEHKDSSKSASEDAKAESAKTTAKEAPATKPESAKETGKDANKDSAKKESKPTTSKPAKSADKTAKDAASDDKAAASKHPKIRFAQFILKDTMPETSGQSGPFGDLKLDLKEAVSRIDKAGDDKSITGAILDIRDAEIGRGKIQELRGAIQRFRSKGKKIYAVMDSANAPAYLVACACNEIVLPETGEVELPGIHAEATFYKGLLNKLGVEADFIHLGDYKGYAEPYTREKFSEPVRENMTALVDGLYDEMVTTIVKDRPLSVSQVKEIIDTGLLTATKAKELGLIDRVAYADDLRNDLAKSYDTDSMVYVKNYGQKKVDADFSGPMGFLKLMQAMMGSDEESHRDHGQKIAVVYAVGAITSGKSKADALGDDTMGSTTICEAIRKAKADKDVKAIVLRIDSPGGSALASDLIWHETQGLGKPLVASMSDVAASGGYYIAMGADKIYATPGTITGSIGVVGGKLAVHGLYDKVGISTETIERGRNSGLFSSSEKFTDSEREVIKSSMEDMYRQFTEKAAKGRHMPVEKLRALAGGRVYTGRQALSNGLVDQLGTLDDAIDQAKQLAGIDKDAKVTIEKLPEPTNFLESLFGDMDAEEDTQLGPALGKLGMTLGSINSISPELASMLRKANRLRAVFDRPTALVMPFDLEIR
jgi:protease-4